MTAFDFTLRGTRVVAGRSGGLDEPTAVFDFAVSGAVTFDAAADARIRAGVEALCEGTPPEEHPLAGLPDADWPDSFLLPPPPGAEVDEDFAWLGRWVVAVVLTVQRLGGDPVFRGRVLRADPERLLLALPYWRQPLLNDAVQLALSLVRRWLQPDALAGRAIELEFPGDWAAVRNAGLAPTTVRLLRSAVVRGLPFEVLQYGVRIGWGAHAEVFDTALTGSTPCISLALANNKDIGRQVLVSAAINIASPENDADIHRFLVVGGRVVMVVRPDGPADVCVEVHPDNSALAVRAARIIGLDIAGVDLCIGDLRRSWLEIGGGIADVHPHPDMRPFWRASPGRDVTGEILEILFADWSGRIPTAAITGTNGKTTTSLMLHRIWNTAGKVTGVCTTTEVRIGRELVRTDNLSGFPGARVILGDPVVEAGVFEMPRKGLIVFGHPCDRYDVAALLNVQDDHLGEFGIHTLEQMAELKAEVLQRARHAVVVNADDPLCMSMREWAGTDRHILVARDNATLAGHRKSGGEAVFIADRDGEPWIVLATGDHEKPLMQTAEIPATMRGLLRFNETNAMFAAAIAWAQGIDVTTIRRALGEFHNSVDENPGRYNFIEGFPFQLLLDYGHNTDGVREVCAVADALAVRGRRLVCTLTVGNLDTHQFADLTPVLARSFDHFVVGCVPAAIERSGVHGTDDPVATMLSTHRRLLLDHGVPEERITVEADPADAVRRTLAMAEPGDLVVLLAKHQHALPVIDDLLGATPAE